MGDKAAKILGSQASWVGLCSGKHEICLNKLDSEDKHLMLTSDLLMHAMAYRHPYSTHTNMCKCMSVHTYTMSFYFYIFSKYNDIYIHIYI